MENIERMKPSQTYEVMDLWLRTTIHSNSFVEENFWETHYDFVKEKYINGKENFVYIIDGKIVAFTGVTEDNRITGLFVDPEYQNKGIGTALINFLKSEYNMLHIPIYARNRKALAFATRTGFIIDGALRHEHKGSDVHYAVEYVRKIDSKSKSLNQFALYRQNYPLQCIFLC